MNARPCRYVLIPALLAALLAPMSAAVRQQAIAPEVSDMVLQSSPETDLAAAPRDSEPADEPMPCSRRDRYCSLPTQEASLVSGDDGNREHKSVTARFDEGRLKVRD